MPRSSSRSKTKRPIQPQTLAETLLSPSLLESIPDAIVAVDREGTVIQINSQTEQLFGYLRDELVGNKIEILVPEAQRLHHHQHRLDFAEQPKTRRMGAGLDLRGRRRDGSEFPVEISLSPVFTADGMLVLSAIRDITHQKRIEEELRRLNAEISQRADRQLWEYQSRLVSIVDSSEDAIIGKDLDGIITAWNKGAEHLYGYTAQEMVGQSISKIVPKDRPDEIQRIMEQARRGERLDHYESVRVAKDGRRLDVSISVSPMRDSDGNIVGASAIARDITIQKKTEEQLRQAQKMEAIGRLAGGVAHDFNNILGIITACTELLRDRVAPSSGGTPYLENIKKAAERGAALTRQLLAVSRKQVIQPEIVDLNQRLKEATKLLKPLMGDDVEIVLPRAASALVEVDPGQLDQIVLNLAVNARDAMPNGGKLILETAAMAFDEAFAASHPPMKAGKYALLAVSDTGTGMDQITVSRIFEPFFTTKEIGKGTGLGLATVYGIVKQAGGYIWVYSEPGRGTTFKIYLPGAEHKIGMTTAPEAEGTLPKRHGTTILLVEDDEMMRGLTKQMLEEHGYGVIETADGQAALEAAAANPGKIHLMLTDVVMRGLSGPELGVRLGELQPAMKIVYMSGYTGELIAQRDPLQPGVSLLEKPFTRASLLKIVHNALG